MLSILAAMISLSAAVYVGYSDLGKPMKYALVALNASFCLLNLAIAIWLVKW